jgi:hypothetical protein
MVTCRTGVLVNGMAPLSFSLLLPRDTVVLSPDFHCYVTRRIRPFVGPPPPELLGKKCPCCRIPFSADAQVISHLCGLYFHYETEASHPDTPESDRLNCAAKLKACLSCHRPISPSEFLVWEPSDF